ncbi:MAG TPA: DUF5054 domain-containing protein [Clostridia bacterium]|nr:DUF5054 domain-containing protein [Clostridia bacterium]
MKKIHLISKTHLDMGFTDYAHNIVNRYREEFIPNAVNMAEKLNEINSAKKFIWTTGSWLIADSLQNASDINKLKLDEAIKKGYITWHGFPFTTHTELLDEDTLRYGLSISKELDERYGKNTIAAKMTDVPGHTKAIIPILQEFGIKLLHIGVNGASCLPCVPEAFLWEYKGSEVMVIYDGSYGSLYKNEYIDDILCFIHSNDNHGPSGQEKIDAIYKKLKIEYPDYEICASTLDEYAEKLYKVKDKLPKITSEIGDTWIHGLASDPYKTGAYRELVALKNQWLAKKKLDKESVSYKQFSNNLLQIAEHTWGMDVKKFLSDFIYLKNDFERARAKDKVSTRITLDNLYLSLIVAKMRKKGVYAQGSYKAMEQSWAEQRQYLTKAINCLDKPLQKQAIDCIGALCPKAAFDKTNFLSVPTNALYEINDYKIIFNDKGVQKLTYKDTVLMENSANNGTLNYYLYGNADFKYWRNNYMRNYKATKKWSAADFIRPGLKKVDRKYAKGIFPYTMTKLLFDQKRTIIAEFSPSSRLTSENGAPALCEIKYSFEKDTVTVDVIWLNKSANRLPEATFINFPIKLASGSLRYTKIGSEIDPYDIVKNGNRNLSAVENIYGLTPTGQLKITNVHSPLVSIGLGKILQFDNIVEDVNKCGVSFNLHNNIWGTNFPLWYEDNAYFKFIISVNN